MQPPPFVHKLPLWAERLHRTIPNFSSTIRLSTPEAGLQQAIQLAEWGWQQILQRLKTQNPHLSQQALDRQAYHQLGEWKCIRDRLTYKPPQHDAT